MAGKKIFSRSVAIYCSLSPDKQTTLINIG